MAPGRAEIGEAVMALSCDQIRQLSLETSMVAVQNVAFANHSGLVTMKMHNGIIQRVWCGTQDGLLLWVQGKQLIHLVPNAELPLVH